MKQKAIQIDIENTSAKIVYHSLHDYPVKTMLVSLAGPRRVLNTREGYRKVSFVANHYNPEELWDYLHRRYEEFERWLPQSLAVEPDKLTVLSTGADMDNLGTSHMQYDELSVQCLATAGVTTNAQRMGVDTGGSVEKDGKFEKVAGTINIILLTNATLSDGAMARAIITATEAKTAVLQDLDVRSTYEPQYQATGTGTDNMVVVSGTGPAIDYTGGHSKMGELIAKATRTAVLAAIIKRNPEYAKNIKGND